MCIVGCMCFPSSDLGCRGCEFRGLIQPPAPFAGSVCQVAFVCSSPWTSRSKWSRGCRPCTPQLTRRTLWRANGRLFCDRFAASTLMSRVSRSPHEFYRRVAQSPLRFTGWAGTEKNGSRWDCRWIVEDQGEFRSPAALPLQWIRRTAERVRGVEWPAADRPIQRRLCTSSHHRRDSAAAG